jgi:hypothetical protein
VVDIDTQIFHLVNVEPIVAQCEERFMSCLIVRAAALAAVQTNETVLVILAVAHAIPLAWRAIVMNQCGANAERQRRDALLEESLAWRSASGEVVRILSVMCLQHSVRMRD